MSASITNTPAGSLYTYIMDLYRGGHSVGKARATQFWPDARKCGDSQRITLTLDILLDKYIERGWVHNIISACDIGFETLLKMPMTNKDDSVKGIVNTYFSEHGFNFEVR